MNKRATIDALRRLADDPGATPHEAEVARAKADSMEAGLPPPPPPTAVAAPAAPEPGRWEWSTTTSNTATSSTGWVGNFYWRRTPGT